MSFSNQIKKFSKNTEKAAEMIFKGTALDLFGRIVARTPVDTGRLRGNWYAELNKPSDLIDASSQGYEAMVMKAKIGDSIYFVNNLPYAKTIEDGSSTQAPSGMVKVTITEFQDTVKKHTRKNRK